MCFYYPIYRCFDADYVQRYATEEALNSLENKSEESDNESELSSLDSFSDDETQGMEL